MQRNFHESSNKIGSVRNHFIIFILFITLVFFTGGASRPDVASLIVLRPASVIFGVYAIIFMSRAEWLRIRTPLVFFIAIVTLTLAQLIPLPSDIWTQLPGRQNLTEISTIAGIDDVWRPLSLSPHGTINALLSFSVPIAALLLFGLLNRKYRRLALHYIIGLVFVSALIGIMQISGSPRGPLYFYEVTNNGSAVGLFANRNHHAVLLAWSLSLVSWYFSQIEPKSHLSELKAMVSLGIFMVFLILVFVIGSRAGLAVAAINLAVAYYYLTQSKILKARLEGSKINLSSRVRIAMFWGVPALFVSLFALMIWFAEKTEAWDRILATDLNGDFRGKISSTLFQMVESYFPWGSGFGSFEPAYKSFEQTKDLLPQYLNEAHNDWVQILIEGGLAASLFAAAGLIWIIIKSWKVVRLNFSSDKAVKLVGAMFFVSVGLASLVDYPLRTPIFICLAAICASQLAINSTRRDI